MVGGPSAVEQADRYRAISTDEEVEEILEKGAELLPSFPLDAVREVGAGLRAATYTEDFIIGPAPGISGFYDIAGMQSPGVASIPAVVEMVLEHLREGGTARRSEIKFVSRAERRARRRDREPYEGGNYA